MRLIDADALKKAFKRSPFINEVHLYYARQIIRLAPTIEERPQGKWLTEDNFDRLTHTAVCSNCRLRQSFIMTSFPFCPNCGARMKGGDEK